MSCRLIEPGDPAWDTFIQHFDHDFYHLPAYTGLAATYEQGQPCALLVELDGGSMLLPLIVREVEGGGRDATSAYGHPGPLASADTPDDFLDEALRVGAGYLEREGFISLFVRLHPILNARPPEGTGVLVQHGDTVSIDLSKSEEELWRETRRNHRQQIRQATEAGLVARLDEDWSSYAEFKRLYRETMERLQAEQFYFFTDDYFDALRRALEPDIHLVVVEQEDTVAAAMLVVETASIVVTHLSGADAGFGRLQPTKLIYDFVRGWGKARGDRWVQMGGGYGGSEDSLLHFKTGFSPLRSPFYTLRHVVQPDEYRRRVAQREALGEIAPASDGSGYFPAYRSPLDRQPGPPRGTVSAVRRE